MHGEIILVYQHGKGLASQQILISLPKLVYQQMCDCNKEPA
jgi:hypothetical protein